VRGWTCAAGFEGSCGWVGDVLAVVGGIEVLAVPASVAVSILHAQTSAEVGLRWKAVIDHNPSRAWLFRELKRLRLPRPFVLHTDIRQLAEVASFFSRTVRHVADEHAEARLEGSDFRGLGCAEEGIGHVIDHHAAVGFLDALLGALGDALVGAVLGFEEDGSGPVIAWVQCVRSRIECDLTRCYLLVSSTNSQLVHVDCFARSWPFSGSIVTLNEFYQSC
jgi:hypothetical protein